MWDFVRSVLFAVIPTMDADPVRQFRWRLLVGVWLIVTTAAGAFFGATLLGMVPFIFRGYATAIALERTNAILDDMRINGIERDIRQFNIDACNNDALKNYPAREYAQEQLEQALVKWQNLNQGRSYPYLPSCDKVVTVTVPVATIVPVTPAH